METKLNPISNLNPEPRLPQIDPLTFSALNTLDNLIGKAALTRQEHAEANRSLQHLMQTIELLQATVRDLTRQNSGNGNGAPGNGPSIQNRPAPQAPENPSRIVAAVAEEIFRNSTPK